MSVHVWQRCRSTILAVPARAGRFCLAVAAVLLALTGTAAAAPLDSRSDHAALVSYRRFMAAQLSNVRASGSAAEAFVASVSAGCQNAVAAVAVEPSTAQNERALKAFVEEAAIDLAVAANAPDRVPFSALADTLARLRWTQPHAPRAVRGFLGAARQLQWLSPSSLCADANALATTQGQTTPSGTLQSLAMFGRVSSRMGTEEAALMTVLRRHTSARDAGLVKTIDRLATRLDAAMTTLLTKEMTKLLIALGLPA
jgi:hypothetical protein